ncbi:MAG: hypothetical protein JW730_01160 [Anaerolineales bacterium]|nr:hypothetical protein [Anaerolineales bacterium]
MNSQLQTHFMQFHHGVHREHRENSLKNLCCDRRPLRARPLDAINILLVHAAPPMLTIEVRSDDGERLAYAQDLPQTADRPMARLTWQGKRITREDLWPTQEDIGRLVILPGGEVGQLLSWWNAEDGSEWRWQIEFYNHR